jgi:hypothetical protein
MHNKWKLGEAVFYLRGCAFNRLLVKFMSDAEREELEDEERLLKLLLDFHTKYIDEMSSMSEEAKGQHIDAILDRLWEGKQLLKN